MANQLNKQTISLPSNTMSTISQDMAISYVNYKVYVGLPPDAVNYTSNDGTQFYAALYANFYTAYGLGVLTRTLTYGLDAPVLAALVGHDGLFDFQRQDGVFYGKYTNASNYAVGVVMNGAGYGLSATIAIAGTFAIYESSQGYTNLQRRWWSRGWNDAQAGRWE